MALTRSGVCLASAIALFLALAWAVWGQPTGDTSRTVSRLFRQGLRSECFPVNQRQTSLFVVLASVGWQRGECLQAGGRVQRESETVVSEDVGRPSESCATAREVQGVLGEGSPDSAPPAVARSERHPRALSSVRRRRRILMSSSGGETDDEGDDPPAPVPIVSLGSSSSLPIEARVFSPSERGPLGPAGAPGSVTVAVPTALPFSAAAGR